MGSHTDSGPGRRGGSRFLFLSLSTEWEKLGQGYTSTAPEIRPQITPGCICATAAKCREHQFMGKTRLGAGWQRREPWEVGCLMTSSSKAWSREDGSSLSENFCLTSPVCSHLDAPPKTWKPHFLLGKLTLIIKLRV